MSKLQGNTEATSFKCYCGGSEYLDISTFPDEPDVLYIHIATAYSQTFWERLRELFSPQRSWEIILTKSDLTKTLKEIKWQGKS